ncbi:MAG: hypothetical protein ACSHW1_20930 [Yoonia sp.]|uniref:hypothetical protein n=1 Tax=Yoonia sp. TaxID=2212373 RepID=UPI003EF7734C
MQIVAPVSVLALTALAPDLGVGAYWIGYQVSFIYFAGLFASFGAGSPLAARSGEDIIAFELIADYRSCPFGDGAAQTPIELTLSTYLPPAYEYSWHPIEDFVEEVERESEGRVKINVCYSRQLFDGYQELGAVSRGNADIVNLTGTYASGTVPARSN